MSSSCRLLESLAEALGIDNVFIEDDTFYPEFDDNGCFVPWNKGKKGLQEAWNKGIPMSEDAKNKMGPKVSKALKGVPKSEDHKRNSGLASGKSRLGKSRGPCSEARRENIRRSRLGKPHPLKPREGVPRYEITTPKGEIVLVHSLNRFCKENGLTRPLMGKVLSGKRNHHKGYKVKELQNDR
jgi:hypothetical protein